MFSDHKLLSLLEQYPRSTFWVAYSGGLDSQVLLHALSLIVPLTRLRAIHVNHMWHNDASLWAKICQKHCMHLGVRCEVITMARPSQRGISLEAYAREARYAAMAKQLSPGDCLLTAHHLDDQAETFILQALRGAGPRGLAGIPSDTRFGQGHLVRPLLAFTRAELRHYAQNKQLTWMEDRSNSDLRFNRNFVRHQVLPVLHQRWPSANKTLARAAAHAAETQQLLEVLAHDDYLKVQGPKIHNLVISHLLQFSSARRRNCLRYWLCQLELAPPSQKQLEQIERLLTSKPDANPELSWARLRIRRYKDLLYVLPSKRESPLFEQALVWNLRQNIILPLGTLRAEQITGHGIACARLDANNTTVIVDVRRGGERFHMQGRQGSHPLKKLFQEWGVPPWQRQNVPLIYYQKRLIAVINYGVDPDFLARPDERGYVIRWEASSITNPSDLIQTEAAGPSIMAL